jgi:mRNA interferase MazF
MTARRGEVWTTNLDPVEGHEQAGRRPALVLSVDSFNASSAELVTLRPLTSKARPNNPFRVELRPPQGGVKVPSYVIGEQVRTVSTRRLGRRLGAVSPATMAKVSEIVRMLLGL